MKKSFSIKTIYIFYILYFLVIPFGFLTRILYSHTLTPTEFGFIYSLYSFFGFISLFTNLGFSSSLKYFIPKFEVKKEESKIRDIFYYALFIQQFILWASVIILYLFSKWIVINYFHNIEILLYFKFFILYFIFLNLFTFFSDVLVSFKLNIIYQIIYFFQMFLIFFLSFLVYFLGYSNLILKYFLIIVLMFFISFLLYFYFVLKNFKFLFSFPKYDRKLFREFFSYSISMFVSNLGLSILLQTDTLVIIYFLSSKYVGYYTNASVLIDTMVTTLSAITLILMPYFTELKERKDYKTLNLILNTIYNLVFYLIMPFSLIFFLFSNQILSLIYGKQYLIGASVLMILSIFSIFKIFLTYNLTFVNAFGLGKKLILIIFPVVFLNLILDLILVKYYGLNGVASATVLGWILISILTFRLILKEIKNFSIDYIKYLKILVLSLIFVFCVIFLKSRINFFYNYYFNSLFILIISFIVYFILGYLFKIYTISELYIFIPEGKIKNKVKKFHKKYLNFIK